MKLMIGSLMVAPLKIKKGGTESIPYTKANNHPLTHSLANYSQKVNREKRKLCSKGMSYVVMKIAKAIIAQVKYCEAPALNYPASVVFLE